ncbi:MAG: hypothetical protein ABJA98_01325 [Acidobacteriota bacterium]
MLIDQASTIERDTLHGRTQTWHGHSALTQVIAGWRWVRLAHVEAPRYIVLLKISANADEHDAVSALEWWLCSPGREDGDVVEVI